MAVVCSLLYMVVVTWQPDGLRLCCQMETALLIMLFLCAIEIIPREAKGYSFGLVGLSVRPSVRHALFLILCAYRLRDYATHNNETYTI